MAKSTTAFRSCGQADNVRTQFNQLRTDFNTLIAKLNLDSGVNATDYAATTAAALTER
jgi:hypothetical protein